MTFFDESKNIIDEFFKKINEESDYDVKKYNFFSLIIQEWIVYIDFLRTIFNRYKKTKKEFFKNLEEREALTKGKAGSWEMTPEELKLHEKHRLSYIKLRLEIESFHLFFIVFLNNTTMFPEKYFIHEYKENVKFGSFHKFWNKMEKVSDFNPIDKDLLKEKNWVLKTTKVYRDVITHPVNRKNSIIGITWTKEKSIKIFSSPLHPKKEGVEYYSEEILEIVKRMPIFLNLYTKFLLDNIDKSILRREETKKDLLLEKLQKFTEDYFEKEPPEVKWETSKDDHHGSADIENNIINLNPKASFKGFGADIIKEFYSPKDDLKNIKDNEKCFAFLLHEIGHFKLIEKFKVLNKVPKEWKILKRNFFKDFKIEESEIKIKEGGYLKACFQSFAQNEDCFEKEKDLAKKENLINDVFFWILKGYPVKEIETVDWALKEFKKRREEIKILLKNDF